MIDNLFYGGDPATVMPKAVLVALGHGTLGNDLNSACGDIDMTFEQGYEPDLAAFQAVPGAGRLNDAQGDAVLAIDLGEHRRRLSVGVGAETRLHVLDTLTHLPLGQSVPEHALADHDRRRVQSASDGLVELTVRGPVRRLQPAVEVLSVQVAAGSWWTKLRQAAAFARLAPSAILVSRPPSAEQMLQADYFGIGLAGTGPLAGEEFLQAVVPKPSSTAVAWLFRERAYKEWLKYGAAQARSEAVRNRASPADAEQDRTP
ncbi:hypothetical protein [Kineosporia sp. NBRC 101731]|uniref:hypothetical protein n=1 Tax=Kineosporia sp. NBRC 101731 TaxID=3032199 RepID=UPI0024A5A53F|nr:hypothetical protein [Kineosporia sp. NBRC 101731]GLY32514.1 hypothetical protein Kisp02_58790 [Kineosporia sp. NBRC 101731]